MPDVINYKPSFAKSVAGRVYAKFSLHPNGNPVYFEDESGLRHYTIDVRLKSPHADDIELVEYLIDDPTFYDPRGFSDEAADDFHEVIQSYGDVPIDVKVHFGTIVRVQRVWLSQLLLNGHNDHTKPAIKDALDRIMKE